MCEHLDSLLRQLTESAEQGDEQAQFDLDNISSYKGKEHKAMRWLRLKASSGYTDEQYNLGLGYLYGEGAARDSWEAVHWILRAAESKHADAQYHLGMMYFSGRCITRDSHKAVSWLRKAAMQGHADAQELLGWVYYQERVVKNYPAAMRWFRKAAKQGLADAQYNLGVMYFDVMENMREAYIWLLIATLGGHKTAKRYFRELPWQEHLTATEIKSAETLAIQRFEEIESQKNSEEK